MNRYLSMAMLLFAVLLSGCDVFNEPIEPFVRGQTGLIRMAGGVDGDTVFPVVESTLMVPLVNGLASPLRVLVLSNGAPVDPARIWADDPVVEDRVVLHIRGAAVGEVFNLTLRLWAEGSNRVFDDLVVPPIRCIPKPLITSFGITSPVTASGTVAVTGAGFTVNVPYGTAVTAMTAVVTYTGTSITGGGTTLTTSPAIFTGVNFTNPVPFTVTTEDGSSQTYTVTVTRGNLTAAIGGTLRVGQTLTAIPAVVDPGVTLSYQWERNSGSGFADIPGATGLTYVPANEDLDNYLRVTIRYGGNSITSAATGKVKYVIVNPASQDLTIKFGMSPMVGYTFTSLHQLISDPEPGESVTLNIALGDYIDLPALTVTGYPTDTTADGSINATDQAIGTGRLLRLIVVGINTYSGINGNGTNPHVVFQFQNLAGQHRMNPSSIGSVGGYKDSEMRAYLIGNFLPGLINAGVPSKVLWAPNRKVWNGDKSGVTFPNNPTVDTITDLLWLPTEGEMTTSSTIASLKEYAAGQVTLPYYNTSTSRNKRIIGGGSQDYWLASPASLANNRFCYVTSSSSIGYNSAASGYYCAPAFCVK